MPPHKSSSGPTRLGTGQTTNLFSPGGTETNTRSSNNSGGGSGGREAVRSGFNHFSDIFSEFTRHIAPTYHHERPERSIQMRLYTMHKGQYLLMFIMFLCLFFIALLMGMAGPRIITEHTEKATMLKAPHTNKSANIPRSVLSPQGSRLVDLYKKTSCLATLIFLCSVTILTLFIFGTISTLFILGTISTLFILGTISTLFIVRIIPILFY